MRCIGKACQKMAGFLRICGAIYKEKIDAGLLHEPKDSKRSSKTPKKHAKNE